MTCRKCARAASSHPTPELSDSVCARPKASRLKPQMNVSELMRCGTIRPPSISLPSQTQGSLHEKPPQQETDPITAITDRTVSGNDLHTGILLNCSCLCPDSFCTGSKKRAALSLTVRGKTKGAVIAGVDHDQDFVAHLRLYQACWPRGFEAQGWACLPFPYVCDGGLGR